MKKLYLLLAIVGWVLPYYFSVAFLFENGLDLGLLLDQLFANDISTFFAVDLVITAIVFLAFLYCETSHWHMANRWVYVVATLAAGPSFSLPLFLYFRESRMQALGQGSFRQGGY